MALCIVPFKDIEEETKPKKLQSLIGKKIVLEKPKDRNLGHFATPVAFSLAKELRKNPMIIAEELASNFANDKIFEEVQAIKGFINFKLSKTAFLIVSVSTSSSFKIVYHADLIFEQIA